MPFNAQKLPEAALNELTHFGRIPNLLLHSCCGPCSSYVLEYLSAYFEITVFYYNPNIYPPSEFEKRAAEQQKLIAAMTFHNPVHLVTAHYNPEEFDRAVVGLEGEPEGGRRCLKCFELRLEEAAHYAKAHGFDYFTTTLSVSPHKDSAALNQIGGLLGEKNDVRYLYADFKKKNGYKRSIELSEQYDLYRQQYCGCKYSLR